LQAFRWDVQHAGVVQMVVEVQRHSVVPPDLPRVGQPAFWDVTAELLPLIAERLVRWRNVDVAGQWSAAQQLDEVQRL
jgi:hypothetical protein